MIVTEIHALHPPKGEALTAADIIELYAPVDRSTPWLRVNFIESLDGSATLDGRSGGLGRPADKVVFDTLRGLADVVLVGAGTARAEGYGALSVRDDFAEWRRSLGLPDQPTMALVSARLDLDPASALFAEAPVRPIVFTVVGAAPDARARLERVATVVNAGRDRVDPAVVRRELASRGLPQVLCEGGPTLFGDFLAARLVDELCLTISPVLEGGAGPRIAVARAAGGEAPPARASTAPPSDMELGHLLRSGSLLLTRWVRATGAA
jgi:riboflavin biosynthesis pyrimidine reductase